MDAMLSGGEDVAETPHANHPRASRGPRLEATFCNRSPHRGETVFLGGTMVGRCQTLMIAEPGCILAKALDPWLADTGYEVKAVDTFKDALMTLQNEKVDALVMDVCLVEGMGYEAISILKGVCRHLPIIITTEQNNPEQESSIRQKGIFYYHVRSFGMDELILAISNALKRSSG
jgi:DNA-binding NtrC family response regulator